MSHDIHEGRMVYAGEVPWHGLGVQLPANATWEEVRARVGFYQVEARSLYMPGMTQPVPDKKAIVRTDTGAYLSTVGADYGIVQFDDLAEAVVKAAGDIKAVIHTAGLLGDNGIRGWIMGELPGDPLRVRGDDSPIKRYFTATTAHTGWTASQLRNNATRIVCRNTLGMAMGEREGAAWAIRHTANAADRVKAAGESFRALVTGYERFGELANVMAGLAFTDAMMEEVLDQVIPVPEDGKAHPVLEGNRDTVRTLWAGGSEGMAAATGGTAWAAWQALTEYADHKRPSLPADTSIRLDNVWFGTGADLKRQALHAVAAQVDLDVPKVMAAAGV